MAALSFGTLMFVAGPKGARLGAPVHAPRHDPAQSLQGRGGWRLGFRCKAFMTVRATAGLWPSVPRCENPGPTPHSREGRVEPDTDRTV